MKFIKVCPICGAFINKKNEWQRLRFWNWYKKFYLMCAKKDWVADFTLYYEICDKC